MLRFSSSLRSLTVALVVAAPAFAHGRDIVDITVAGDSFQTLTAALKAAELVDDLKSDGPLTVFAPTDEAFDKLPKGLVAQLLRPENKDRLVSLLTYHVVAGNVSAADAVTAGSASSLEGRALNFSIREGRLTVAGANVIQNDLEAKNGRIHVIDSVLVPPGFENTLGRKVIGVYFERPSKALAAQLLLDRSQAQLVTGVTSGSNAQSAGLQKYDIITSIDGGPAVKGALDRAKEHRSIGELIPMTVLRGGRSFDLKIAVGLERH